MRALVVAAAVLAPLTARAEDDRAKALFDEGMRHMKAGNHEQACAAFRESNRLDPDSGTRGSLARCYEKLGRVASAWRLWVDLSTTAPERLRPAAAANARKLEPRLPRYVLQLAPGTPAVAVTIDGEATAATLDTPTPIDPGPHVVEASADGYAGFEHAFTAAEGKTETITIALAPAAKPVEPAPVPAAPAETTSRGRGRTIGIALIGVGGALVIGGGVFGVIAKGRYDDAKDICGGDIDACDPLRVDAAQDKVDSARTAGTLSTVSFIAGGVAIVGGVILLVRSPTAQPRVSITPSLGPASAGIAVGGAF